jgi:hypothetical protein
MTKQELLDQMRTHQTAYSKFAAELKEINLQEDKDSFLKRQLERLEQYRAKYKFYADPKTGETKEIDWVEVEKLISTNETIWALGFDSQGMCGLAHQLNDRQGGFQAMVEDEVEAKRYSEREKLRAKFIEKTKRNK